MLVFAIAVPLVIVGRPLGVIGAARIPVVDLALAFVPMIAAVVLEFHRGERSAVTSFLKNSLDPRIFSDRRGLLVAVGLAPLIYALTLLAIGIHEGGAVMHFGNRTASNLLAMFALFAALAVGEEVGWTGFATEPLQYRFGSLGAALTLAVIWWLAHLPSMAAVGATTNDLAWWGLGAIGVRVLMVWLFDTTRQSVVAVIVFHALLNTGRMAVFPAEGARFASEYQIASYLVIAALAAIALVVSRARLAR